MKEIDLPKYVNYIGVFLTLRCNMNCSYCLNKFGKTSKVDELSTDAWIRGLSKIPSRPDLPITLQGGEPTIHPGFCTISSMMRMEGKYLDLLTNGTFNVKEFCDHIHSGVFNRAAKYASVRFSYHTNTNPTAIAMKVFHLQNNGYNVGIWGFDKHQSIEMIELCKQLNIDYREKEYLGWEKERIGVRGTYKYPNAIAQAKTKTVMCKPSEFLISPSGYLHRCHADLYLDRNAYGHILDKKIKFPGYSKCKHYGACNPCDIKIKTDRFQESGHCSVKIKKGGR